VGVVAEAGTGKSRLCFEFLEGCRAAGLRVLQGTGVAHGKNIPLLPMMQVFRQYYGITEQDSDRAAREKIAGRLLLIDAGFAEVLPLVFEFFGVPDPKRPPPNLDADAKQRQIFGVLRTLVQWGDPDGPLVVLVEDLHWIDEGSEAFLAQWVDAVSGASSLLVVNFRPEYHAEWMQKSWYHQLALAPLGPDAIRELLDDVLGSDASLGGLAEAIHTRTGGNPFFTEEVVQTLIEAGHLEGAKGAYRLVTPVEELAVPATVQSVLSARIDRLVEREKQVLQTAAVIGKEFAEPILVAASELSPRELQEALAELKRAEFLYEEALYPVAEYAFKHPLTQEVAYRSQLLERRRRIHARVARAIEEAEPEKVDEHAALLAHHCEEAGDALAAAGWYARGAEWVRRSDPGECLRLWRQVRTLTSELPETETRELRAESCLQILSVGGWRMGLSDEEIQALYAEGRELGVGSADPRYRARLALAYAPTVGILHGDVDAYMRLGQEAAELASGAGDPELQAGALVVLQYSHLRGGRLEESLRYAERAIALTCEDLSLGRESMGFSVMVWTYVMAPWARIYLGEGASQPEALEKGMNLARREQEFESLGWMLGTFSLVEFFGGSIGNAELQCMEALEHSERMGSPFSTALARRSLGLARFNRGNLAGAIEDFEVSLGVIDEHRTARETESEVRAWHALALAAAGELDRAAEQAAQGLALARERGGRMAEIDGQYALARIACGGGRADEALACLDAADEVVRACGARAWEPLLLLERAEAARLAQDADARRSALRKARLLATEFEAIGLAERASNALADV
jgi:adenylate cyclase